MKTLLVTSTEAGTGKTAVALALARLATERGDDVGYMKPKGTRLESNVGKTLDADPMLARELLPLDAEMHELEPVVYSPTFIEGAIRGRENPAELRSRVQEAFDGLAGGKDLMVVEGADDLATGGIVDLTDAEVADLLDAEVVVLSRYSEPGDIDDVLAAADDLGDRCAGVVFNAVQDAVYDDVETNIAPFLDGRDVPVLGVLPRDADLAGVTIADLATELGAEVLTEDGAGTDERVERFLVGAMSGEAALSHFRRTKDAAVITGGDRADVQTAALDAPGVTCLVLTGGHRPSGAVLGKAAENGVPVLSVQSDTLTTVERAEELVRGGRVRDERTVDRMQELLYDHADVDALLD
ncbi:phosphotransacetylase family protein [Halobacterium sp. KA-4]|uniref:phosphotransacetylase family protein n=1 Tax=Halobacterium sp. KA-4 TaxID=2896367 RepID=UPI001E55F8E8|nr:phosphotransacetylase family protein [Halobacterium sp. KA-4]MCD2199380.1 phosphotransacetylase family protein [Halobacterium sp. KA-4]